MLQIDLAVLHDSQSPPPPGLDHTPKPGEVFVSPEAAKHWSNLSKQYGVELRSEDAEVRAAFGSLRSLTDHVLRKRSAG